MPISRGNLGIQIEVDQRFWEFYGRNMFLAETSSTTESAMDCYKIHRPLKPQMASEAYGSCELSVTNETQPIR
jgi:arginine decarboxylase